MSRLVLVGAKSMARLAHFYFSRHSPHQVAAFAVDHRYRQSDSLLDLPVIDFEDVARRYPPDDFAMFIAIGYSRMNEVRAAKFQQARALGYELVSYVCERATYLSQFSPGPNSFIQEGCVIQPYVKIGSDVIVWGGTVVAHDTEVEDHCFFSAGVTAGSHCRIGAKSFVGLNATLSSGIHLAPGTLVGAGALLSHDTSPGEVYAAPKAVKLPKKSDEIDLAVVLATATGTPTLHS